MSKYKIIDLFAGTGAFSHVFKDYDKFETVYINDMVKESEKIINLNHPEENFVLGDINKIEINITFIFAKRSLVIRTPSA